MGLVSFCFNLDYSRVKLDFRVFQLVRISECGRDWCQEASKGTILDFQENTQLSKNVFFWVFGFQGPQLSQEFWRKIQFFIFSVL